MDLVPPHPLRRPHRLPAPVYTDVGRAFVITVATRPRQPIFDDRVLGSCCRDLMLARCRRTRAPLYAYCLMPDHAHFVVGAESESVVALVREWKSRTYLAARARGVLDPFWQRSFWDRAVRGDERALLGAALYVLGNPVRAGLVGEWHDYPLCGSAVWEL